MAAITSTSCFSWAAPLLATSYCETGVLNPAIQTIWPTLRVSKCRGGENSRASSKKSFPLRECRCELGCTLGYFRHFIENTGRVLRPSVRQAAIATLDAPCQLWTRVQSTWRTPTPNQTMSLKLEKALRDNIAFRNTSSPCVPIGMFVHFACATAIVKG